MLETLLDEYEKGFNLSTDEKFCLYIDLPFCRSVCKYCIHNTSKFEETLTQSYKKDLIRELTFYQDFLSQHTPYSLYFGGGTPSLWTIEELQEIRSLIPNYDKIQIKKFETHPYDLTPQYIQSLCKTLNLTEVSIGVQSFDRTSCSNNHRLWCNKEKIKEIVQEFQNLDVLVNLDLVCLFGGDASIYYDVFKKDLDIATTEIKPDCIMIVINYKTLLNYEEQVPLFNKIVLQTCQNTNMLYRPLDINQFSNTYLSKARNDKWIANQKYIRQVFKYSRYSETGPDNEYSKKQITLGLGGFQKHPAYGIIPLTERAIYSRYNFERRGFDYLITDIKNCPPKEDNLSQYLIINNY